MVELDSSLKPEIPPGTLYVSCLFDGPQIAINVQVLPAMLEQFYPKEAIIDGQIRTGDCPVCGDTLTLQKR